MVMHSMFSFLYKNKDWIFRDPEGAVKIPCVNGGEWESNGHGYYSAMVIN